MPIAIRKARVVRSVSTLLLCCPLFLLTQCGHQAVPQVSSEHCGGVTCTGNSDCTVNVPLCAQSTSATCLVGPPRECAWKLAISSSCPCMEHDVRLCTVGASTPGVQICTANGARTATYWAACVACPSCTP
jgi:hypothetical protein